MNILSTYKQLNSNYIAYEIRRNPINIYNFKNIVLNNSLSLSSRINNSGVWEIIKENFLYNNDNLEIPKDCSMIFEKYQKQQISYTISRKTYIYKIFSVGNIGHFVVDNLYPILKMIFIDQNMIDKPISELNRDVNIFLLNTYSDNITEQCLWKKHLDYLLPFSQHKIQFLSEFPTNILFQDVVICTLGLSRKKHVSEWIKHTNVNEEHNVKFMMKIRDIYYKFYNINKNSSPKKIVLLSRKNARHRKIVNEGRIIEALENKFQHVEYIQFEKLNLLQELQLLTDTYLFITPHGAGVVSSFFIPENSHCLIFHPKGFGFTPDFPTIYKRFLDRLKINTIQYENTDKKDKKLDNLHANRDKHFVYMNVKDIIQIVDEIIVKRIYKDT